MPSKRNENAKGNKPNGKRKSEEKTQVAVAKVAHSEEMRGLVDRAVIDEQLRSPAALTMALLGLMSEDCLIRQKLSRLGKRRLLEAA